MAAIARFQSAPPIDKPGAYYVKLADDREELAEALLKVEDGR